MTNKKNLADKKEQLIESMAEYAIDGCIDITRFRLERPTDYALLPHYFGTINNAIEQNGWIKIVKTKGKQGLRTRLRDQLALYALRELRKDHTLDQIGEKFGSVTRAAINQLHKALEKEMPLENQKRIMTKRKIKILKKK